MLNQIRVNVKMNKQIAPLPRIGLYEKAMPASLSWHERFATAQELGFDFLEISIDETDERLARLEWDEQTIQSIRSLSAEFQIPIHSMCLSAHRRFPYGSMDEMTREHADKIMQKALNLATKLGVRVIQLAGYDVYYEPHSDITHTYFIEGMKRAAQLAERAGVMLGVEIMDTPYLNSISKFLILKREIPSPYFMVYPDVGNLTGWLQDVPTELRLGRDFMVGIHLKDSKKVKGSFPGQFRDLVIGEGQVDFKAIFSTLQEINYSAPFVIEMWANDTYWKENIVASKERLVDMMTYVLTHN